MDLNKSNIDNLEERRILKKIISLAIALCFLSSILLYVPMLTVRADTLVGDLNGDGHVNILDAVLASNYFGWNSTNANWTVHVDPTYPNFTPSMADLNGDGVINILDLIILAQNFQTA